MSYTDKYIEYKTKYLELVNNTITGGGKKKKMKTKGIKDINRKYHRNISTRTEMEDQLDLSNIESAVLELEGLQSIIVSRDNKTIYEYPVLYLINSFFSYL